MFVIVNMCFVLGPIFSVLSSACGTQPHRKLKSFFSARKTRALYVSCRWLLYNSVLFATSIRAQCEKASLKIKNNKHMSKKAQRADTSITRNSSVHQHWSDEQQKRFAALEILSISVFSFCGGKLNNNIGNILINYKFLC